MPPQAGRPSRASRRAPDPFNPRATYQVFLKRHPGGGRTVVFVECDAEGFGGDAIYEVSASSQAKVVEAWEITSPGVATSGPVNRAQMGLWGYVGKISGYGANQYFREGGDLKRILKEYGEADRQRRPGWLARVWRRFRGVG